MKLDDVDEKIAEETKRLNGVTDVRQRAGIAQKIYELAKQKEKIKNGARD